MQHIQGFNDYPRARNTVVPAQAGGELLDTGFDDMGAYNHPTEALVPGIRLHALTAGLERNRDHLYA